MIPHIDATASGSITIEGETYTHDVLIRLSGQIIERKKALSESVYGTDHVLSLDEAKHIYEEGTERLIIGTGRLKRLRLSEKAKAFFREKGCRVTLESTPQAAQIWNGAHEKALGLFHVDC